MKRYLGWTSGAVVVAAAVIALLASGAHARDAAAPPPAGAALTPAEGAGVADGDIALTGPTGQPAFPAAEFVSLTFNVINTSATPCGLATEPLGTMRILSLRRDGEEVIPRLGISHYPDGITRAIAASVTAVDPGSAIPVRVFQLRPEDEVLLRSVTPSGDGGVDTLWPVSEPGRYELTVVYAVPPVDAEVAPCTGSAATTVTFTVGAVPAGRASWLWWVAAAAAALTLGVVAVAVLLVRRRGRRPRKAVPVATVALLLGVAASALALAPAQPAQASIISRPHGTVETYTDIDFNQAVTDCLSQFRAPGGDPANIVPYLEDPAGPRVLIVPVYGGSNAYYTPKNPDALVVITWNPVNTADMEPGVPRDPCASLYHELAHAYAYATGTALRGRCGSMDREELRATIIENQYRASRGLPLRTMYGGRPLPRHWDECPESDDAPQKVYCENDVHCGRTSGDPHLVTFDRQYYDFQAVGEFVLVRATSGPPLQVQVRQAPFDLQRTVSVNTAVAMQVGDDTVALRLVDGVSRVFLDGDAVTLPVGETTLPGGGRIVRRVSDIGAADGYDVIWPDGSTVWVDHDVYGYRVLVRLDDSRAGAVEGLLGNFDGDPTNDLVSASGELIEAPFTFADLYPSYADRWRVTAETSLFPYADGESTETFTDRDYPAAPASVAGLDEATRAQAEQVCRFAGVTDPWLFAECVLDVGVSGRPEFAVSTAATARTAPPAGAPVVADPVAEGALAPGGDDRLTFTGRAGDVIVVDAVAPGLADGCSPLRLLDPAGTVIGRGCFADGRGFVDRVVLAADGEYSVALEARSGDRGRAMVRVYTSRDTDGSIEPNGAPVTASIDQPGSVARYTFTGAAGQRVFVAATEGTLRDQCSPLRLLAAHGDQLEQSCLVHGRGYLDDIVLPADGTYTVVVDPVYETIGTVTLQLHTSEDLVAPITPDGPPVTVAIDTPGAVHQYEFTGTAGTSVTVVASDGTLPDSCPPLRLVDATGRSVGSSCFTSGGGRIGPVVLPADGTYRIVVDPVGAATGVVTLTVRSE